MVVSARCAAGSLRVAEQRRRRVEAWRRGEGVGIACEGRAHGIRRRRESSGKGEPISVKGKGACRKDAAREIRKSRLLRPCAPTARKEEGDGKGQGEVVAVRNMA